LIQKESQTGNVRPVGHRRVLAEPSASTLATPANSIESPVGRRVRAYADESQEALRAATSTPTPGRRRKLTEVAPASTHREGDSNALPARTVSSHGSRRKPDLSHPAAVSAHAQIARYGQQQKVVKKHTTVKPSGPVKQDRVAPFVRKRLVPVGGFSALVIASVASFVDVSAIASAGEYKDVITTAAVAGASTANTSRNLERAPIVDSASARADIEGSRYVQKATQVHADAAADSAVLATLAKGDIVRVTGVTEGDWSQVIHKDLPRWVESSDIAKSKPRLLANEGAISDAACSRGSSIESRLQPDTVLIYRAVCERFPEIRQYWGQANRGTHGTGHSLDIMVAGARGHEVAAFLQDRYRELGVQYIIYQQRIWNVERQGAGWRGMENRGSATANHFDHVHVTTYGNAAKR